MTKALTVGYIGNFRPPMSTENDIRRSLEAMGHSPIPLQEDDPSSWERLLSWTGPLDFVLWTRTWHLPHLPQREALAALRDRGVPTVGYHLDKYWGLPREEQVRSEPWWTVDFMFTADGGNDDRFAEAGINHRWLPPGVLADHCNAGALRPQWIADVGFIGSVVNYHPEWRHRQDLVAFLSRNYGPRFRLFGRGAQDLPMEETADAIASLKVVVGDSCNVDGHGRYWSNRIPETLGRAGFLVHPRVDGIEEWYTDREHLALYEPYDWDGLLGLIEYYLQRPGEAREIALAGQELVRSRDTFAHRLGTVVDVVLGGAGETARERLRLHNPIDLKTSWEVWDEDVYQADQYVGPGATVVDLGANVGLFAIWALERGARLVRAVEPWEENLEAMARNLADASVSVSRVDLVRGAVWNEQGRAGFTLGEGDAAGRDAHVVPDPFGKVDLFSLDDVLEGIDEVDVLKVDVEGAEYPLFAGASDEAIARCRFITIEYHNAEVIAACGWEPTNALGRLVERLAETHHIEVLGRPSAGGYVRAVRYEDPA